MNFKLLTLPFKICNKYYKLKKVLKKQTLFYYKPNSVYLGKPPLIAFNNDDTVTVSIVVDDDDYDDHYNISSICLTFTHYGRHIGFGDNLLIDNSESTIEKLFFPDYHIVYKKQNDNVIDIITKSQQEYIYDYLYNEEYLEYTFFIPYTCNKRDLIFVTGDYYLLLALEDFLSKVNNKKVVREDLKTTSVYYYIE